MQIESPFDMMAETYDLDFTWSKIGVLQREKVREILLPFFGEGKSGAAILEMNCGTGEDAIWLARMGHHVIATDASAKMIEKASEKKVISGVTDNRLQIVHCSFQDLSQRFEGNKFDWIFSNFGGINCVGNEEIAKLAGGLSGLLNPGGRIALVIMSRFCIWETFYYSFRGKWKTAFRRSAGDQSLVVGDNSMPFYHYSPREVKKIFKPHFVSLGCFPVGLLIPPSYLEKHFANKSNWLFTLDRWEGRLNRFESLSRWSDHYCILFKKNEP